jgi:hypothetical protein
VHNARRRGKGQSRILYWFRTPPGVRVGRSAIDEDAIRLLEQHNPDVQFDWTHILKPTPQIPTEPVREHRFEQDQDRGQRRKERRAFPRPGDRPSVSAPRPPEPVREEARVDETAHGAVDPPELGATFEDQGVSAPESEDVFSAADEPRVEPVGERTAAASQRLGSEGLARLRARYAEVMARIAERPMEDAVREELKARAERLNPDAWVTADEVQQALEQYESVYEGVRALVGTRRRRRRRKGQGGGRQTEDGSRTTEEGSGKTEDGSRDTDPDA